MSGLEDTWEYTSLGHRAVGHALGVQVLDSGVEALGLGLQGCSWIRRHSRIYRVRALNPEPYSRASRLADSVFRCKACLGFRRGSPTR